MAWRALDPDRVVFVEDDDTHVGTCSTPKGLYDAMRAAPLVLKMVVPMEARLTLLVEDYSGDEARSFTVDGQDWKERMASSITNLTKRLGGAATQEAMRALESGDMRKVAR